MKHILGIALVCALAHVSTLRAGDFRAPYYAGTPEGSWSQYALTAKDGTASTYTYERKQDVDGHIVLELHVKTTAGMAAGSESTMTYTMPAGFDLARDGMSYGKFIEKMSMKYGEMEMDVDETTLGVIRGAEKDYRGNVTHAGTETVAGLACDRYTYAMKTDATTETGTLWVNDTVPFAVVKHAGKVVNADGVVAAEFEMVLSDRGRVEIASAAPEPAPVAEPEAQPITVSLVDGFNAGRIGLDVEALNGGRQLRLNIRNEYDAQMTIDIPAAPMSLTVGFPVDTLGIRFPKATRLVLEARDTSEPMVVSQTGARGIAEGKCYLSVYEDTPLFQGSVTMDKLPK